jgi:hypothetical protein
MGEFKDWVPVITTGLAVLVAVINFLIARTSSKTSKENSVNIQNLTDLVEGAQRALITSGNESAATVNKLIDVMDRHFGP